MSTNKTQHYSLHAWEAEDDFLRSEFNENFAALDAAVAAVGEGKLRIATGSYSGNDNVERIITVGFKPKAVILETTMGYRLSGNFFGGIAVQNKPGGVRDSNFGYALTITDTGFRVSQAGANCANASGRDYYYIAIG